MKLWKGSRKLRPKNELQIAEAQAALGKVLSVQGAYDKAIRPEEALKTYRRDRRQKRCRKPRGIWPIPTIRPADMMRQNL